MNLELLNSWLWKACLVLACFAAGLVFGLWVGNNRLERLKADYAAQVQAGLEANRQLERRLQNEADSLTQQYQKEKKDAEKTISDLRHRIADGSLRLSVRTAGSTRVPDGSGAEHREARAELDGETAQALVSITADGDDAIRDLNQCIDKYNSLRGAK